MRPSVWIAIVALAVVGGIALLAGPRLFHHSLHLKTYFADAQGLRAGAPVRLAGVEVGRVTSVRVRPELRDRPAEVVMTLSTSYELRIPKDSAVVLASAGVLGPTLADIDIRDTSGPPIEDWGVLTSRPAEGPTTQELFEHLLDIVTKKLQSADKSPTRQACRREG